MGKFKWLGFVGFLLLFYLIIWGTIRLMFSSLGTEISDNGDRHQVFIAEIPATSTGAIEEINNRLALSDKFIIQTTNVPELMTMRVVAQSILIIPPIDEGADGFFSGEIPPWRIQQWADSGAVVLSFNSFSNQFVTDSARRSTNLTQGFYAVHLTNRSDSMVLWFDNQTINNKPEKGATIMGTLISNADTIPVIWEKARGNGKVIHCLARPQSTPGNNDLLMQLVKGAEIKATQPAVQLSPMVFDAELNALVLRQIQTLRGANQGDQINAIAWLAKHPSGNAQYAIIEALYCNRPTVVVAAAEALVQLSAVDALEAIRMAAKMNSSGLRPILEQAERDVSEQWSEKTK